MQHSTEELTEAHLKAKEILDKIQTSGINLPSDALQNAEKIICNMLLDGLTPKESLGLSSNDLEKMYLYAYNLFQAGKFKDALIYFELLNDLDPLDTRYCFAIASCYHYLKNYTLANAHYMKCMSLDPINPIPHFHFYDCCMKLNQPFSAYVALHTAITLAKDNPQYSKLKEKAQLELNFLENYLKQYANETLGKNK